MRLTDEEQAMRAGRFGPAVQWAIEHQIKVGEYLGAGDFVPVSQAHIMADTESLGTAGVEWLERMASLPRDQRQVRVPTITDPRGTDFAAAHRLKQQPWMLKLEERAIAAFETLGVLMTNSCINYQTIMPPVFGEHVAYGDTGVVIYCNSVCGARSNFEGGPSALAAALTGQTPRYGYHLEERRRATFLVEVDTSPRELNDWGALGGIVGRLAGDYWQVPAICGIDRVPSSDEIKHFGAALASYGSVALFHMLGITPEAQRESDVLATDPPGRAHHVGKAEIRAFQKRYTDEIECVDLVVFSAPQLSLLELQQVAALLEGRRATIPLLVVTSPSVKTDADRLGLSSRIEAAGGIVLSGMCFYQSYAREMAEFERVAAACDEFGKANQHHWGLRIQACTPVDGGMYCSCMRRRQHCAMMIFFAKAGMGQKTTARALVAKDGFSARYDLDRLRGVFSRPEHKLAGESYVGRVLVLDAAKGGVATAWMLHEMKARAIMPAALVLNVANPIMVQGVAFADFTMISGFDLDITQAIPNGAMVEVDPTAERPFIHVLGQ